MSTNLDLTSLLHPILSKTVYRIFITIGLIGCFLQPVRSTHLFGAEIYFECLNDTDKRIYLRGYRTCEAPATNILTMFNFVHVSGPMTPPEPLGSPSDQTIEEINSTCPAAPTLCSDANSSLRGIEDHLGYQDFRFTPGSVWKVTFTNCCRPGDITNGGANDGFYIEALIDNTFPECNSSPVFAHQGKFQACVNQKINYSVNAIDPDGDELRYSLVDCMDIVGSTISYLPGFSGSNPISTMAGMEWSIDELTGQITGTPDAVQSGFICVKVEEYRDNVKIGEIVRDLGFFVTNCSNINPEITTPFSYSTVPGEELCFNITGIDANSSDNLSISSPLQIGGQLQNTSGSNPITSTFCWTPSTDDIGLNYFTIDIEDDACPYLGTNTYTYQILVEEPPVVEIYEIQGTGSISTYAGMMVTTINNVVTAVGTDGFTMQTPTARTDGDALTSDGIFVSTGVAPTLSVGDLVDVTGLVEEFFFFTRFATGSSINVVGTGSVPAPVALDDIIPSPDPNNPSCGINNFECLEGMLVSVAEGTVTGPNQRFGPDPIAEVYIVTKNERTFVEPGIDFPGIPGYPVYDGNPEIFEMDPDRMGLANQIIPAGSTFNAEGVIGFEFNGYELWPTSLNIMDAIIPIQVRPRNEGEATIATCDLFRLFDDVDDPSSVRSDGLTRDDFVVSTAEYQRRITKLARYIVEILDAPDLIGVQEAEKLEVLQALADEINILNPSIMYTPYLEDGNDLGTIDVGFLVRETITVSQVTQLGKDETFLNPNDNTQDLLHDRPPLLLEGTFNESGIPVAAICIHNRSRFSIESNEAVRVQRLQQALSIAQMIQDYQTDNYPYTFLAVLGGFNATEFTDGYVDVTGLISGLTDPLPSLLSGPDLVDPDLFNEQLLLPASERYSFNFLGSSVALDHILTSPRLHNIVTDVAYGRGNADAAFDLINDESTVLSSSDHDGMVIYVDLTMAVIPTLSQWGIIVLMLILGILGITALRSPLKIGLKG